MFDFNSDLSDLRFEKLADIILEWNEKINVTAIRERGEFMEKNVKNSLAPIGLPEFDDAKTVLDLGTGGGFPGLPLAIACPGKQFFLLDSVAKKLKVVAAAASELMLENVDVLNMRAEDLAKWPAYRENMDVVVSRAVANMSTLSEYCLPFVRPGGFFIAFKTENAFEEINAASNAVEKLGGELIRIVKAEDHQPCTGSRREGESGHILVIIKKIRQTPAKYPRRKGLAASDPLK